MKSGFKPPVYSEEEKNEWRKKVEEYYIFFAEIVKSS